jgi:mannose-6-phosphate isomerase
MADVYPMLIEPKFDERIWGGHNLAALLGKQAPADKPIGESWEIYDDNRVKNGALAGRTIAELRQELRSDLMGHVPADHIFPMLTKLIDAQDVLSVQVHPNDRFARQLEHQPNGKTECWYIIQAEPDAKLIYGFSRDTSPEEYQRLVQEGKLDQVLRSLPVQPGDVVYLPAGVVHAIGAGIVLFELQQTSDVTYRIYDWNRKDASGKPRELHVERAKKVLDYQAWTRGPIKTLHQPGSSRSMLVAGQYFCLEMVSTAAEPVELSTYDSPVALCALDHSAEVGTRNGSITLNRYSSALLPAALGTYTITSPAGQDQTARALVAYVPASQEATRQDLLNRGFSSERVDAFLTQFAPAI